MADFTPEHPKPYEIIDFANRTPRREPVTGHEVLRADRLSGYIELYIIAHTNLQVASGAYDARGDRAIAALETRVSRYAEDTGQVRQKRVIPGSSLKGMVRNLVEILSPSCLMTVPRRWTRHIPAGIAGCQSVNALCPACRLFGMTGAENNNYLGQMSFEDAQLVQGKITDISTPQLWSRNDLPPHYLDNGYFKGRKVYHHSQVAEGNDERETFAAGSILLTTVHFENLLAAEMGLFFAAIGLHPKYRFLPKLGAGKPVGMGSIEAYPKLIKVRGDLRRNGRMGGRGPTAQSEEKLQERLLAWSTAADRHPYLLHQDTLFTLADMLQLDNLKRPPVDGTY